MGGLDDLETVVVSPRDLVELCRHLATGSRANRDLGSFNEVVRRFAKEAAFRDICWRTIGKLLGSCQ